LRKRAQDSDDPFRGVAVPRLLRGAAIRDDPRSEKNDLLMHSSFAHAFVIVARRAGRCPTSPYAVHRDDSQRMASRRDRGGMGAAKGARGSLPHFCRALYGFTDTKSRMQPVARAVVLRKLVQDSALDRRFR